MTAGDEKPVDHIHCAECFHPIYEDQEQHTGQTVVWVPGPQGLAPVPRPVPLCQACWQLVKEEAKRVTPAVAPPRLIIPKHNGG